MLPIFAGLLNAPKEEVVQRIVKSIQGNSRESFIALHISAILNRDNPAYLKSLEGSHCYVDGIAAVLLARRVGFNCIERTATTDITLEVLSLARVKLGRSLKIGLIGGSRDLVNRTKVRLETNEDVQVLYALPGFRNEWLMHEEELIGAKVDLVFIGMGVPLESIFLMDNANRMEYAVALTCGGLFKFLVGDEKRAPKFLQNYGFEWAWRFMQDPFRLFPRYFKGAFSFLKLYVAKS